jgi:hypothetical protein
MNFGVFSPVTRAKVPKLQYLDLRVGGREFEGSMWQQRTSGYVAESYTVLYRINVP